MQLTEKLINMEEQMENLLEEIRELKRYAYALEDQNERLRVKLYEREKNDQGRKTLENLYEEGYHICPAHFAMPRRENQDCLFCLSFLSNNESNSEESE